MISPTPVWGQHSVSERSALRLRFFEAEKVNAPACIAGDDQLAAIGRCAAIRHAVAGEGR